MGEWERVDDANEDRGQRERRRGRQKAKLGDGGQEDDEQENRGVSEGK